MPNKRPSSPPLNQFLEIFDQKLSIFDITKTFYNLSSNDSLSTFSCQNYFLRPNAHFRSCFDPLWVLVLEITSDSSPPPPRLDPPAYKDPLFIGTEEYVARDPK